MEKILLIGASDHCRYAIDIIEQERKYEIVGILDRELKPGNFCGGYQIVGYLDQIEAIMKSTGAVGGLVAIGDNFTRKFVAENIKKLAPNFQFVNAVHPSVILGKEVQLGVGILMMAGVIVNNNCIIGDHCYLATKSSLDHDSILGNFSSLSPGVTTGGRVIIGNETAIGIGATILHYKKIGDNCVIGGNSLVTRDIENNILAFGLPAKPIRARLPNEKYL